LIPCVIICWGAHGVRRYSSRAAYTTACEAPTAAQLVCSEDNWTGRRYCARCSALNRTSCCCSAARSCISPPPAPAPGQLNFPTIRQMQLVAAPKLLPPPAMARGIPHIAAREVQGWLPVGLWQQGDRVLVSSSAGVHTALGDVHRAQFTQRLVRRLPLHSSSVPRVNGPGGGTAHDAARRIAAVAAALLPNRAIPSIPCLHLTDG